VDDGGEPNARRGHNGRNFEVGLPPLTGWPPWSHETQARAVARLGQTGPEYSVERPNRPSGVVDAMSIRTNKLV
jgi:hypothetical protein